jgi:hypothetical protein
MGAVIDEVLAVAAQVGCAATPLTAEQLAELQERLRAAFGDERPGFLSDTLRDHVSVHDDRGWERAGELVAEHVGRAPVILIAERDHPHPSAVRLGDGRMLGAILAGTTGYQFYVTDLAERFVLAHNDEGLLIAAGAAAGWVSA